jgi:hypothetical protein
MDSTAPSALVLCLILLFGSLAQAQNVMPKQNRTPTRSIRNAPTADEMAEMRADVEKMNSLLNQMEAVFALVGNPSSPANHELQLNIEMWRVLIGHMQRQISHSAGAAAGHPARQE